MRIAIIGADTSHTLAFAKSLIAHQDITLSWVDLCNYTDFEFSKMRSPMIKKGLKFLGVPLVNGYLSHEPVDAYCILNLDAQSHRKIINDLSGLNKPIFIDKPIFYTMSDFKGITIPFFSSSALRFCSFTQKAKSLISSEIKDIWIEGPLSFVNEIEGYFWYGIHLLEIVQTLGESAIVVHNVEVYEDFELVSGQCGNLNFTIKGIKVDDPAFLIRYDNQVFTILDDQEAIYDNLIHEMIEFFITKEAKGNPEYVIQSIIDVNKLRY